ncbi:MAG: pyridoxal-phosphate dependent enzyme [Halobacteriales archaeon]
MAGDLVCHDCGATYDDGRTRCDCGEPLWYDVAPDGFAWDATADGRGVRRYADLLPDVAVEGLGVGTGGGGVVGIGSGDVAGTGGGGVVGSGSGDTGRPRTDLAGAAGDTPLVRAGRLDEFAGARVWLKDETENPTGSFKDRGSAVGVAAAAARGTEWVGTVSHGNMAMSVSAFAAAAGLEALVLVPADIPPERLAHVAAYDPELVAVDGDYGQLYRDTLALEHPVAFLNSDVPLRVAGQKTTAIEIAEAFARGLGDAMPDAVVLPVSSGGHASAAWKGFRDLVAAGLLDAAAMPRLYLVQAAACAPIAAADRRGADAVTPVAAGETIAFSIANGDPPSGNRALAAARETGGAVVSVGDEAIREARRVLATRAGLQVEPASAVALAGLRQLAADGAVGDEEDAVVVATGTGFTEADAGAGADAVDPTTIDLADLAEAVDGLVG